MLDFWFSEKFIGDTYEKLIRYALKTCDAFMFVCCNYYNSGIYKKEVKPFVKDFQPLAIKRRHDPQWPGTTTSDQGGKYKFSINFYRCDESAYDLLIKPGNIFGWEYPHFPENLCFFREGYVWLSTVTHECMLWIECPTKEDIKFFKQLGVWEDATVSDSNNDEPYFESGISSKKI